MKINIEISKSLWLVLDSAEIEQSGLFTIRDDAGGDTIINVEEIPRLIEVLQQITEGEVRQV